MYSATIIPIGICVVLPIAVVLIIALTRMNSDNKRTQIILKAIEANNEIDADRLAESLRTSAKSAREMLYKRLYYGVSLTLLSVVLVALRLWSDDDKFALLVFIASGGALAFGIGNLVVYFVSRKYVDNSDKA